MANRALCDDGLLFPIAALGSQGIVLEESATTTHVFTSHVAPDILECGCDLRQKSVVSPRVRESLARRARRLCLAWRRCVASDGVSTSSTVRNIEVNFADHHPRHLSKATAPSHRPLRAAHVANMLLYTTLAAALPLLIVESAAQSTGTFPTSIVGTWSTKSNQTLTGPGFYDPINGMRTPILQPPPCSDCPQRN